MTTWSSPMFAWRKYSVFRTHVDQHACKQVGRVVYDQSKCPSEALPFLPSFLCQCSTIETGSSCAGCEMKASYRGCRFPWRVPFGSIVNAGEYPDFV